MKSDIKPIRGRNWTPDEIQFLEDKWGQLNLKTIASTLNRSPESIKRKAANLGLGSFLTAGGYVTLNQLFLAIGMCRSGHSNEYWINRGLPVKYKAKNKRKYIVVYLEDFWNWAEKNKGYIDWSKFPRHALGKEPSWVRKQRLISIEEKSKYKTTPWTKEEDDRLIMLLKQHKYSIDDISKRLGRTAGAIQRRCYNLGIKERPVQADNHNYWSEEEYRRLGELIKAGYPYELLSEIIGRSSKAIRGRVYCMYMTENLDKVREYIGNGNWGDNRPERPITHITLTSAERQEVKRNVSKLAGILRAQAAKIGYDTYWQKDMCQHWEGYCTANQTDCDSCSCFQRIKPQYCARCGSTFHERKQNKICASCRTARKKQAQKKYAILSKRRKPV